MSPNRRWMTLFAGTAGGPVYWSTRSTEYAVVDGVPTPVRSRFGALVAVWRARADGAQRVAYLLQGCNATAVDFRIVPTLVHPITGEPIPTTAGAPLKLGWNFAPDGTVTEDLLAANGTRAIYRGRAWESPGSAGERAATLAMNIRLLRPSGAVESFSEVSVSRARTSATAADGARGGFIAAESETSTLRQVTDKAPYRSDDVVVSSLGHAVNHADVDALRSALGPAEVAALDGFFAQQADWVRAAF